MNMKALFRMQLWNHTEYHDIVIFFLFHNALALGHSSFCFDKEKNTILTSSLIFMSLVYFLFDRVNSVFFFHCNRLNISVFILIKMPSNLTSNSNYHIQLLSHIEMQSKETKLVKFNELFIRWTGFWQQSFISIS